MANGRPTGDGPGHTSRGPRGKSANQEGLAALGRQMRGGSGEPGSVANEAGLKNLGERVDAANHPQKSRVRRSGKPKWSARKKTVVAILTVVVILVAAVGGGYGYLWYRYDQINKVHIGDEVAAANGAPFTTLVIGSDSRVGITGTGVQAYGSPSVVTGQRSDVVQLWRVTPATKTIQVLSIPATRWSPCSHRTPNSSARTTASTRRTTRAPTSWSRPSPPTSEFRSTTWCRSTSPASRPRCNALGGIYLDFPYPAKDSYSGLDITTPGCQLLNGTQALAVARARHYEYYSDGYWQYDPTSDFGRIERQDVFLRALIAEAKSKVNPLTVNAFIGSIHEGITIDDGFGFNELVGLALDYHSFNPGALQTQTLPTVATNDFGDLGDVLTVDQPAAQQTLVNIFGSSLIAPTNPPPDANGVPQAPPPVAPATATTPSSSSSSGSSGAAPAATTTTTVPPSFNPVPCTPSWSVRASSWARMRSMPISPKYPMAAIRPIASAIGGVPASKRAGGGAGRNESSFTSKIMPPPPRNGAISSNSEARPHRTPMPVGPIILWPENAMKSTPSSSTVTGACAPVARRRPPPARPRVGDRRDVSQRGNRAQDVGLHDKPTTLTPSTSRSRSSSTSRPESSIGM